MTRNKRKYISILIVFLFMHGFATLIDHSWHIGILASSVISIITVVAALLVFITIKD